MATFNKTEFTNKLKEILKKQTVIELVKSYETDLSMMQKIYPADKFLEGLTWIGEHLNIDIKDEVYKGFVFMLGVATLNGLFIDHLNKT